MPRVVLLVESSRFSGRSLLRGIANYARDHGPWTFIWEPGGLETARSRLKNLDADGIILRDVEGMEHVLECGLPAVIVGHSRHEVPGVANVTTDSEAIGILAAEHLLNRGFRQFAYCGVEGSPWSVLRGDSFARRLQRDGFETHFHPPPPVKRWRSVRPAEGRLLAEWVTGLPKPLGVMAGNDDRGEQVIEACKMAGIRVPDDVAIVGADNDDLVCDLSDPPLSSVAIGFERAGYECAGVLDGLMRGDKRGQRQISVLATHVVTRRSTDIVAVDDPQLAAALRFIRDHARDVVSVPDVARAAGLSRRVLERRFRSALRRSALAEIRRVRVAQICRLLVETSLSVSEIARALGYQGSEHLARYFRSERHIPPLAYRKRFNSR